MRLTIAIAAAFLITWTAGAGPVEETKLIGFWELTKVEGQETTPNWRIEFTTDGKLRMQSKREGKEYKLDATYVLKKDKLTITVTAEGKTTDTKTVEIETLTDRELVFIDNRKKMEFKRAK